MGKKRVNNKRNSMFLLLVRPILLILLIMMGSYTILMHQKVLSYLKINAVAVFEEQVSNQNLAVSGNMVNRWSNIQESVRTTVAGLERIVKEQNAEITDIHTDAALNQQILDGLMDELIGILRTCGATEVFLVLDGNAVEAEEKEDVKAGIYLRNNNPNFYSNDNQDLLFERGVPALSKKWKITLDSYWKAGFDFSDESDENNFFYVKPFHAAKESDNKDFENFAYWTYGYPVDRLDEGILTYSVPLITSDGTVIGVMGVGVSEEYFAQTIYFGRKADNGINAYFLGKTKDGVSFEPVIFSGFAYNKNTFLSQNVRITGGEDDLVDYLYREGEEDSGLVANVGYLQLYNNNTPFEEERWAIVGVSPESELLSVYNSARMMLAVLAVAGIAAGVFGGFFISRMVSRPLRRLMEDLRKSNTNHPIHLHRLNVEEVDELINAIESLSARVAASSSKISTIIQMAESGIGVFEYRRADQTVFCSRSLYEIFYWNPVIDTNEYIDSTLFRERMRVLEERRVPGEANLFVITAEDKETRWIRLNQVKNEESVIGVITDVTAAVLEKQQMEYERDYDTLTKIFNLRAFKAQVQKLSVRPADELRTGALIMWDMDNLKFVNDAYGHHMGDAYITAFADCLRKHQSAQVISARRSGDEFYTLLYGYAGREPINEVLGTMWEEIQKTEIKLPDGQPYKVRVSAGVAWYPENSTDFFQLFQYADFAMYTVKHSRKGDIVSFDPEAYHENWFLAQGHGDFNMLLDNRLVRYAAQPIMSVSDGSVYGYEMLMRSAMSSFQSPAEILKMAHAQSRLYDIEIMTWFESLKTFRRLAEQEAVEPGCMVFINSISSQIMHKDMLALLEQEYADYLPNIVCEFTEEEQGNPQILKDKMEILRRWEAKSALDDYGCGYNSQTVLLELKPDIVKIDMGIVRAIDRDENRRQLVSNLILYAHARNIKVLGEGVETAEELRTLIELGVDFVQGYYIGRPDFEGTPPSMAVREEAASLYRDINNRADR